MKLRSHTIGASSSKGKEKIIYEGSSDEGDGGELPSDSDYDAVSEPDEDFFSILEDNKEGEDVNDLLDMVPKRRKSNSTKNRGSQSREEEDVEQMNTDTESEIIRAVELDLIRGLEKKDDKKKKRKRKRKRKADAPVLMWQVLEQENEKWIAENFETDLDFKIPNEVMTETVEPSDDLTVPLLRYQKEWLAWALKQEESNVSGGILADEMGMGKTIQAISLVLLKRHLLGGIHVEEVPASSACPSGKLPVIRGTLVVCPLVAVMQWLSEIERFTLERSTKVLVYHGANRTKNLYQFSEYDFVITTYSIVESEYRKHIMTPKERCQYCGKLFHSNKLKIHMKYTCGPFARKTAKQSKQKKKEPAANNIADVVALNKKLKKYNRDTKSALEQYDQDKESAKGCSVGNSFVTKSILHSVIWERIVLDEAHYIKERRSNTARAILSLESSYRWALSGTPLQNRVGELYSLVRFIRIVPYSYYFCKDCDCRVLDHSLADCPSCPHRGVRHFCWWNRYIASPIQDRGNSGSGREAMFFLKHKILKSIVLRRTKKERAADLALPPRTVTLRQDSLDIVEEDYYTALYNDSQAQFNTYIEAGTLLNNYAHIFDLLTRLRQAVDHPYLVEYSITLMERKGKVVDTGNDAKCGLCHEVEEDSVVTSCGHFFCKSCLIDFGSSMRQSSCPTCSKPLTVDFTANKFGKDQNLKATVKGFRPSSILNRIQLKDFQTSTKIEALREEIRFMVERDGSAKGLVFSQFSSFLDLIHYTLQKCGVNCVQLDGSMSMAARDAAIKQFSEDPDCRIFLMGLKAGGVALNLTVASHVFLMDPWWNPAVERQAQDRIHRIGQYKPIRIVRFVIVNSIEERILKLQEKKELVFEGTVGGSSEALAKLTEADLRFLFAT